MDPISNADNIVRLLRQKLQERSKAVAKGAAVQEKGKDAVGISAVLRLATEGVDERQLRRALVQSLLVDHLGPSLLNDAQFQQIVSRVASAIEEDADSLNLMAQVLAQLRGP